MMEVFSQGHAVQPDAGEGSPAPRGLGRRLGQKLLAGQEHAKLSAAEEQALKRDRARPALDRATRRLHQAQGDLGMARHRYELVCAAFMLDEAGELDVAALEHEIAELERDVGRCTAAIKELERRLPSVIRDSFGTLLR
jgi:hypothetical protein